MPLRYEIQIEGGEPVGVRITSADSAAAWADVDGARAREALQRMRGANRLAQRCGLRLDVGGEVLGCAIVPGDADFGALGLVEVDRSTMDAARGGGLTVGGTDLPRWRWDGSALEAIPDARPVGTWSQTLVEVAQGDPSPTVTLTVPGAGNRARVVTIGGRTMSLDFVDDVATVSIPTGKAGEFHLAHADKIRLANALSVYVGATQIPVG